MAKFTTGILSSEAAQIQRELAGRCKTVPAPQWADGGGGVNHSHRLPDFTDEVKRGADMLDRLVPGWEYEINLSTLDLADENMCVLGQAFPLYARLSDLRPRISWPDSGYQRFLIEAYPIVDDIDDGASSSVAWIGFSVSNQVWAWVNKAMVERRTDLPAAAAMVWEHLSRTWIAEIECRQARAVEEPAPVTASWLQSLKDLVGSR